MLRQTRRKLGAAIVRTDNSHDPAIARGLNEAGKRRVEIRKVHRDSGDVSGG